MQNVTWNMRGMLRCWESHIEKTMETHTSYKLDDRLLLSLPIGFEMEFHTIK